MGRIPARPVLRCLSVASRRQPKRSRERKRVGIDANLRERPQHPSLTLRAPFQGGFEIDPDLMAKLAQALIQPEPSIELVPLSGEIAFAVHRIDRAVVPDFPDRIIAATALSLDLPLITCDEKIQQSGIATIW